MTAQWDNSRGIKERIVVQGTLILDSPTHLGNGDTDGLLDMPLLLDPLEGVALLPGTSITGALRNHVRRHDPQLANQLFGTIDEETGASMRSWLIVHDALGKKPVVELRDGVSIDPSTRTARDKEKFDIELLAAGSEFPLTFELLVQKDQSEALVEGLAIALQGLQSGAISLGKRKRRGFGRCHVNGWRVSRYDVATPQGLIAWLEGDTGSLLTGESIAELLGVAPKPSRTIRDCVLEGRFQLVGSLLIRSAFGAPDAPDFVHLQSLRNGQEVPVVSGASLAGALRARTLRIANTLGKNGDALTDRLFGRRRREDRVVDPTASRIWVAETTVENALKLVHTRVKIDRFTGGSFPSALFQEQPVYGKSGSHTTISIGLRLEDPTDDEVGLLLLLLKDLWVGDLPLGGELSVGRGRFRGISATLLYGAQRWEFAQAENAELNIEGDIAALQRLVDSFVEEQDQ